MTQIATTVTVVPTNKTLRVGESFGVAATVCDADGAKMPRALVTYVSSNPRIASVNEGGTVAGVATGAATITAKCGHVSASVSVSVSA